MYFSATDFQDASLDEALCHATTRDYAWLPALTVVLVTLTVTIGALGLAYVRGRLLV